MPPQNSNKGSFVKALVTSALAKFTEARVATLSLTNAAFTVQRQLTANSTAYKGSAEAAIPTTDQGIAFTFVSNSTGVGLAVNTTGTTWKWLNTTSVQPT